MDLRTGSQLFLVTERKSRLTDDRSVGPAAIDLGNSELNGNKLWETKTKQ